MSAARLSRGRLGKGDLVSEFLELLDEPVLVSGGVCATDEVVAA